MDDETPRLSLCQVESLVLSLYEYNPPDIIAATQTTLSKVQNSAEAWSMIQGLLERPDEKVQFFGALTIIIKINKESAILTP
ncbi:hypothetical protein CDD83_2464 [Cordyceps sp. RAO-2017]|nr:hypothetical protein CDD83_2464 [Cordyceps sp. RAO-2017]